ncbi:MAG: hypothetical protein LBS72_02155 [Oscillospiraceae bacterium]|jgi:putative aldouronate transport system substrate-binding protein|nr:hypothetical protein [Oscillospiraceae bacterium]
MSKKRIVSLLIALMFIVPLVQLPAAAAEAEPVELELFINHTWWPLKTWAGEVPEYITKQTGVRPVVTVAADMQQLPLMLASGDLPDIIYCDNTGNMQSRLADPSLCWAWEDLTAQYKPDFQWDEERAKLYRQEDGKFYTILNNYSTKSELENSPAALIGVGSPTLQRGLYEELGSPQINTLEDYFNVLLAAKEAFPDKVPAVINTNWIGMGQTSSMFLTQYGLDYNGFSLDEATDTLQYYIYQQNRLDYYKYINALYRNGLILPENFAFNNEDESYQYAYNLECFSYIKGSSATELNSKCADLGIESDWFDLNVALGYGSTFKIYERNVGWSGLYIAKNNSNPQKTADFLTYLFTEEGMRTAFWGIEGTHWTLHEDGYPVFIPEFNDPLWQDAVGLTEWGLLSGTWVTERLASYNPDDEFILDKLRLSDQAKENTVYCSAVGLVSPKADSDEQIILTKLNDMVKNEEVKLFLATSEEECEKAYSDMLARAEQLGVKDLDAWANEAYQTAKSIMED